MRDNSMPTTDTNVAYRVVVGFSLGICLLGCGAPGSLPNYKLGESEPRTTATGSTKCDSPNEGCACPVPGELVDCGEVRERTDDYVTCMQGVRLCGADGLWGACAGDLVKRPIIEATSSVKTLALGTPASCAADNPCDPRCRQIVDTGVAIPNLPEGLCSTATGIGVCPLCGYGGPVSQLPYAEMPAEWQRIPSTCSTADDRCSFEMECVAGTCQSRMIPCDSSDPACSTDLTLGKPCLDPMDPNNTYHIPLCNRGASALSSGIVRIGVDSRSAHVASCVPTTATGDAVAFPDSGYVEIELSAAQAIKAGSCIDVNFSNSSQVGLDLHGSRTLLANFDGAIVECKRCNNGNAVIVQPVVSASSTCAECVGDACGSTSLVSTTLSGVLYDPAGRSPVPNAIVYVPTVSVKPFSDGVACDTCDAVVSGSPSVWVRTDAWGHFRLEGVPGGQGFPLVVQLGRWRRQFAVGAIPSGETRWIESCSNSDARLSLTADATQPIPATDLSQRLRLPATQRRCNASVCAGEGDIPKMALLLGDADPLQCVLSRVGIADSEFTNQSGAGRVQLFNANGMQVVGGTASFGDNGLLSRSSASGVKELFDYSMLVAPCNGEHDKVGSSDFASGPYASGPSYNSWPDPTASATERANVKSFVDAGGRLLATHWLSVDFVHLNYFAPSRADFALTSGTAPLVSPYDDESDSAFSSAVAAYAAAAAPGFGWDYAYSSTYNPMAPAQYLFGANLNLGSNVLDTPSSATAEIYPALWYTVDGTTPFGDWLQAVGATTADTGYNLPWQSWSPLVRRVRMDRGVTRFLSSNSTTDWRFILDESATRAVPVTAQPCLQGDGSAYDCGLGRTWGTSHTGMYQFDAPLDAAEKCGRVGVISGHAGHHDCFAPSGARLAKYCDNVPPYSDTNPPPDCNCLTFPADARTACGSTMALTPEELSFEYLLFSASQCIGELATAPSPPILATTAFVRDFESNCAEGERTVWQLFSWQASVPNGSRLEFFGETADTQAELTGAGFVKIGVAAQTTTTWTAADHTVAEFLRLGEPPQLSKKWLRVKMLFLPNATVAPTLNEWRAVFNCVADE